MTSILKQLYLLKRKLLLIQSNAEFEEDNEVASNASVLQSEISKKGHADPDNVNTNSVEVLDNVVYFLRAIQMDKLADEVFEKRHGGLEKYTKRFGQACRHSTPRYSC